MTTAGSFDAPIEIFSGLVTNMVPADFLHGVSPDCQDVVFSSGGVATLPGLRQPFAALAGNSNGNLYKETMPGTPSTVASGLYDSGIIPQASSRGCTPRTSGAAAHISCRTHLSTDQPAVCISA